MKTTRRSVSEKILAIRAAAHAALGSTMPTSCPTCGRAPGLPYRRYDAAGRVLEGCVDAAHTGHLVGESARWQGRKAAEDIRRATLAGIV